MNTLNGYSKSTLTDQYILTAAGGHLAVDNLLTDLSSDSTNKISITVGNNTKTISTLYASYLLSLGVLAPQTGRNLKYGDVYTYNTNASVSGGPITHSSVLGFGRGARGAIEICGEWTSGRSLWVRALRDVTDNWYAWDRILTEATYSTVLDKVYCTETKVNNKLLDYVTLTTEQTITGSKTFTAATNTFSGTGASILTVDRNSSSPTWIKFMNDGTLLGYLGITNDNIAQFHNGTYSYILLHSGNYSSYLPFLNSSSTHATKTSVIYAPSTAGTKGLILTSNGSGAPVWSSITSLKNPYSIKFKKTDGTSVSYDGSSELDLTNGIRFAKVTHDLAASSSNITTTPDTGKIIYSRMQAEDRGNLPGSNNANGVITINTHVGNFNHQLGFSYMGLYYRHFESKALDDTTEWYKIYHSGNLTKVSQLLNDSGYLTSRGFIGTTTVLASSQILALTGISSIFVNTGDATLKVYNGGTSESNDGTICLLTSIDGTDGLSHTYPTLHHSRCNLALLPRGGLVYIGTNPNRGDTNYKLWVLGNSMTVGTITSKISTSATYLKIGPQNDSHAHYETNASTSHWFNKRVEVDGHVNPYSNNSFTSGTSDKRWSNVYSVLGNFTGAISSSLTTSTHINGNKGTAIINSTAAAGYNMLAKMNSTNGVFTIGAYDHEFNLYYTTNATIAAETNSTTYRAQLLNELGNTVFPGRLYVGSLLNVNNNYFNYGLAVLDSRTATVTGTIVITLPVGFTNSMNTYEIDIYEYNGYDSTLDNTLYSKLIISGYNYTETSSWVNCGYVQLGSYAKGVRLGYNGSKCCILLGNTSSTWKYPKIRLSRVLTAHDGTSNFNTGYSISTITSESGYSKIVSAYRLKLRFERVVATEFTGSLAKTLTFAAGTFAANTYNNSADVTINIPTKTSHLTNDSGFLTTHQSLANYVTLNSALNITAKKTFSVQLEFTVASGTAPFTVTSSTKVTNLNADTVDGYHVFRSGENNSWGTIVTTGNDGVSEMGRYIDFHYDNTTVSDYSTRLLCSGNHSNVITLPSATGTLALTSQIPSVGNGTITINLAGSQVGTFTVNLSGNTTINLTDNNTWRGITDSYTGTDSTISLSQKGANDLLKTIVTYAKGTSYVGASFNNSELSIMAADHYIEYWDSAGGWFNSRWGLVLTISGFKKVDYDDTYVLLAGGGHKALSDLSTTHSHSYLPLNTSTVNMLTSSQMGVLNCNSTDTVGTGIRLYNNGTNKGGLWWGSSYGIYLYNATTQDYLGLEDNGALYFYDKSANNNQGVKYTLLHTGNADDRYIKTTGGIIANANTGLYINRTTAGTNAHMTFLVNGTSVGDIGVSYDKKPVFYDYDASAWVRLVTQSFNGNITATAFYSSSDINLKTNIHDLTSSDNIPLLKEFDWKEDGSHSYGLIAQELEDMGYHELVTKVEDHKTVNYSAALSLIVGKLQVKIKELEKEIENLKNKN